MYLVVIYTRIVAHRTNCRQFVQHVNLGAVDRSTILQAENQCWNIIKLFLENPIQKTYTWPTGSYVEPVTSNSEKDGLSLPDTRSTTNNLDTDIWLVVRVPVLSEQITDVHPRVSTLGSDRTMAFFLAIRRVPKVSFEK